MEFRNFPSRPAAPPPSDRPVSFGRRNAPPARRRRRRSPAVVRIEKFALATGVAYLALQIAAVV